MRFLFLLFFFSPCAISAQRVVDVDNNNQVDRTIIQLVNGEPFVNTKFVRLVSGSPYFKDQWMKGEATTPENVLFRNGLYRLDLVDHEVHFLNNGNEQIATTPLRSIVLTDSITGETYHFVKGAFLNSPVKKRWYLQLVTGKISLYQYLDKQVLENRPYNSATTEQRIQTHDQFYLFFNNTLMGVKKVKEAAKLFPDKRTELEAYWKSVKGSDAEKLTALVNYYNSL